MMTKIKIIPFLLICSFVAAVLPPSQCVAREWTSTGTSENVATDQARGKSNPRKPNFLVILTDDLGWKDVGYNGSPFYETPHIDRFASSGMVFTNAYAASPYCSPTRASIQTGKNPGRLGMTMWGNYKRGRVMRKLIDPLHVRNLPLSEFTLAEAFQEAGYMTSFVGKWHCGTRAYHPDKQGYLHTRGTENGRGRNHFSPYGKGHFYNLPDGPEGEFLTDRLADETIAFMQDQSEKKQPFLAFLSTYAMHSSLDAKDALVEKYRKKLARMPKLQKARFVQEGYPTFGKGRGVAQVQQNPVFAAMLEMLDSSIGRVLAELKTLGIEENTVVIFTSDNGGQAVNNTAVRRHKLPITMHDTANVPLRAGKGYLFEGGIRVPLVVRWPGVTDTQQQGCDLPVVLTDIYPTFLEIADLPRRVEQHQDAETMVPMLKGEKPSKERPIFWHMPQYGTGGDFPGSAVRLGKYKLIHFYEDDSIHLYDLENDLGEQNNLAQEMPEKAREMRQMLDAWRSDVKAKSPVPNPKYHREKDPRAGVSGPKS